jgi:hypothetical protein
MGELVDGGAPRVAWVVADAEGEEHKDGALVGLELEHEVHPMTQAWLPMLPNRLRK